MNKRVFLFVLLTAILICGSAYAAVSITPAERTKIHAAVDAISGDVGDVHIFGETGSSVDLTAKYNAEVARVNPNTLIGAMLIGSSYNSISRSPGSAPSTYPFPVGNTAASSYEYDRKTAKLAWAEQLGINLGFPVVVRRQPDKLVWVEIGDPDAPEMVMALSHLDSPTASSNAASMARWRGPDGLLGSASAFYDTIYHTPYVHDGWIYGAGMQDDSGPTLATLVAAKALMEAGVPMDRRIRILMGAYEDGGPGTPSAANTTNYINIPYHSNPGFYDNWVYKSLNREEMPIAAFTSDSRFPVIVGNSYSTTSALAMNLSTDVGKAVYLTAATFGITQRMNDPTLKDIAYGSAAQVASRAIFTLNLQNTTPPQYELFMNRLSSAAAEQGWSTAATADALAKVDIQTVPTGVTITINTDVAMEFPTPQYGKNAIVWGMYLINEALSAAGIGNNDLLLKKAADGITQLFFKEGAAKEGEAYIGTYMGIPTDLLRNPLDDCPNLTFAVGTTSTENMTSFFTASSGALSITINMRGMHTNTADHTTAWNAVTNACTSRGFTIGNFSFGNATLYLTHDNPLLALQYESYKATMKHDPVAFDDVYGLLDISAPQGTTGGTLASSFKNKMNAFGATIPGNERWWHTANERMKVKSAVQMTKMFADGLIEMARYIGPAGAKFMSADIAGLNPTRADLDLLDVTVGTYKDASGAVASHLGGKLLFGATSFDIPMWSQRGNATSTQAAHDLGHATGGVYLNQTIPAATTYVLPMRLEFKVAKPAAVSTTAWNDLLTGDVGKIARLVSFNVLNGGTVETLTLPAGGDAGKFFYKRVSQYDPDTLYVSVNLAVVDGPWSGDQAVLANSREDLFELNPAYLVSNDNPFPERGKVEQRGFFMLPDGTKNARFVSPSAIFATFSDDITVTLSETAKTIFVGESFDITATVLPTTALNSVTWTSSTPARATVTGLGDNVGIVTGVSAGTTTITATTVDGKKTATCTVTVQAVPVASVTLDKTSFTLASGANNTLTATVLPANATNPNVTWTTSDATLATVYPASGNTTTVTANNVGKAGNVTITATAGGVSASCTVTVSPIAVSSVALNMASATLLTGETESLTATVLPANATNPGVTWNTSNSAIATVSTSGVVTAVGRGIVNITATAGSVESAPCVVTVNKLTGPAGETVTLTGGTEVELPGGSITYADGKIELPNGGVATTVGGVEIELPAGTVIDPDGTIKMPSNAGGTATTPEGVVIDLPAGTIIDPDGTIRLPANAGATATTDDGVEVELPEGTVILPDGTVVMPPDTVATITTPDGKVKFDVSAEIKFEDDGTISILPDAAGKVTITTANNTKIVLDEGIVIDGDTVVVGAGGAVIIAPNGRTTNVTIDTEIKINPDGSVSHGGRKGGGGGCSAYHYFALALLGFTPFVLRRK